MFECMSFADPVDSGHAVLRQRYAQSHPYHGEMRLIDPFIEMSQLSFDHLLQLSFAFHARRKTGEILRILDRGAAINRSFEVRIFYVDGSGSV